MNKDSALNYHQTFPKGKIEINPTKPMTTMEELSLAYTPGVAVPCAAIAAAPEKAYDYTAKGNLVGIITNGTAVLGMGNIGPLASKPVMEGKAVLLKQLAGVDAFDIELDTEDTQKLIETVAILEPTFGGINLEDIKAPDCFEVTTALQQRLNIPVFHDDQDGTAIVVAAAMKSALHQVGKSLKQVRGVIYGAGAGAIASAKLLHSMGLPRTQIVMFDSRGPIYQGRDYLTPEKEFFATDHPYRNLQEAIQGADFFLGLSVRDVLGTGELLSMAPDPIVLALANPVPEIDYHLANQTRDDLVMATGRSDYPNQVNNAIAMPMIFRGMLDVKATSFNDTIKHAAVEAIVAVAQAIKAQTGNRAPLVPSLLADNHLLLPAIATAVAKAAMATGVAREPITDWDAYQATLKQRMVQQERALS